LNKDHNDVGVDVGGKESDDDDDGGGDDGADGDDGKEGEVGSWMATTKLSTFIEEMVSV